MEKIWYIVKDDEHLGPYSYFDLKDFYREKKIIQKTLIWKKGLKEALAFSEVEDTSNKKIKMKLFSKKIKTKEQQRVVQLEEGLKLLQRDEFVRLSNERQPFNWKKVIGAFALTVFLGLTPFAYEVYQLSSYKISKTSGLRNLDFNRLSKVSENAFEEITVAIAPLKDMSELVLATNFPFDAQVELTVKSLQEKMLIPEIIVMKSRGKLIDRVATFSSFEFEVGTRILPGYYQMEIKLLSSVEDKYLVEQFVSLQRNLSQSTVELVSVLPKATFDEKLVQAKVARANKGNKAWIGLHQRFLTIKSIVAQIHSEFSTLYEMRNAGENWDGKLISFTQKYEKYFGSFLSGFIKTDFRLIEGYSELDKDGKEGVKDYFEELSTITTLTATSSARFIHEFEQKGRTPSSRKWTRLKSDMEVNYSALVKRADDGILAIKDKVN